MARILVVDDQEEVAELIQAVLRDAGPAAEAVYSGQAALDRLKRTAYDLVVCDVHAGGRWEGGLPRYRAVDAPTASRAVHHRIRRQPLESEFLQTTAAVVLAKPLGIDELLARVHGVLLEPR